MLIILLLSQICLSSHGQVVTINDPQIDTQYSKVYHTVIHIADSVAKTELKKYDDSHPNSISDGQISLKYYDRTLETILDGLYSFQVNYKYNQLLGGSVIFPYFSVHVDIDKKKTKFISDLIDLAIRPELSTPEKSWQALLLALKTGETEKVKAVTTNNGFNSLIEHISPSQPPNPLGPTFITWGNTWANCKMEWGQVKTDKVTYQRSITLKLDMKVLEHVFVFILTDDGWRMNSWTAGV